MTNLSRLLEDTVESHPDRIAVVAGDVHLSYRAVDSAANRVANLLVAQGVVPGDRIALSCPNIPAFSIICFGILKSGAILVPLNILLKAREVEYHLENSGSKVYFAHEGNDSLASGETARRGFESAENCTSLFTISDAGAEAMPWLNGYSDEFDSVTVDDDDTAVILYTSGTTGQPKGAELRHRNLRDNTLVGGSISGADVERPDRLLCALPLFHSFALTCIQNTAFAFGGTMIMLARFEPQRALDLMVRERVTVFAGVPTMYWALLNSLIDPVDTTSIAANLRWASSGGAALPMEIHRRFEEVTGVVIMEGYGLSETSPTAASALPGESPRPGSIGVPIPGVEMKLINPDWSDVSGDHDVVGEVAIKGHNVMKGYYGRPEATSEAIRDEWFRTGDLARQDEDGYYYIVDRTKDMIIRGGFNVYPREVEELLMTHPDISLVAVIGIPHDSLGEEIKAVVVLASASTVTENEIIQWTKERLAAYKYPRSVAFVDAMPTNATGKILKRELRQ